MPKSSPRFTPGHGEVADDLGAVGQRRGCEDHEAGEIDAVSADLRGLRDHVLGFLAVADGWLFALDATPPGHLRVYSLADPDRPSLSGESVHPFW